MRLLSVDGCVQDLLGEYDRFSTTREFLRLISWCVVGIKYGGRAPLNTGSRPPIRGLSARRRRSGCAICRSRSLILNDFKQPA